MAFQPLINYAGYEHVLNAIPCCVHPVHGALYGCAVEKRGGIRQDLSIYRVRAGQTQRELVHRYLGGRDAVSQIAMGACMLLQDGSLEVWASLVPLGAVGVTQTGFQGVWDRLPGVDQPWSGSGGPAGPAGPAGAGSIALFPMPLISAAWENRQLSGGLWVDIPAEFSAPAAAAYLVRFVASAAPNVRVRAGTDTAPFYLTVNTQVSGVEIHTQGWIPGPRAYISTVNGSAQVWLQILGMA